MLLRATCHGRPVRRGLVRAAATVALSVASVVAMPSLAGLGSAARAPNIVVILTDDQRIGTLEAMPNVRRQLRAEGTTFRDAFVPNALCCPSRASILTGLHSHTTGVVDNRPPHGGFAGFDDRVSIATVLDEIGYRTAFVGRYLNGYIGQEYENWSYVPPGWDRWFAIPIAYYDYAAASDGSKVGPFGSDDRHYSARVMSRQATSFIEASRRPFFLFFSAVAPHSAPVRTDGVKVAIPGPRDVGRYERLPDWRPSTFGAADDVADMPPYIRERRWGREIRARVDLIRQRQLESLYSLDRQIGKVLASLPRNTLVIYLSDNGHLWGEHRWRSKQVPYEESIRIPFIVRWPGRVPHAADGRLALNIDVVPTILAAVGLPPTTETGVAAGHGPVSPEGMDLFATQRRSAFVLEHYESADGAVPSYCGVRTRRWMYARYSAPGTPDDGFEDLYDVRSDRLQRHNLSGSSLWDMKRLELRQLAEDLCDPVPPGYRWGA